MTLLLCAFFSTPLLKKWYERIKDRRWLITAGLAAVMSLCVGYLVDATYNPFLYFNF